MTRFAAKGEPASAYLEHTNNASAAICGDFTIVKSYKPLEIVNLKAPLDMQVCAAYPQSVMPARKTQRARSVVPQTIPISKFVYNVGNAATMASGFTSGDVDLTGTSMSNAIIEPARAFMVPDYQQVKENALKAGAYGIDISGAEPAMIAIVNKKNTNVSKVANAMSKGFASAGLKATTFATKPGKGARQTEK